MVSYKGQNNQPLRVMPKYLLHGPALRTVAITAVEAQYAASLTATAATYVQNDNPNKGLVQRIQSEYLIDGFVDSKESSHDAANYWFLLGEIGPIRGLAYQDRKAPEIQQSRLSDDSDHVFEADEYQFGVRMRGASFVTLPHLVFANLAT
jgi:phage major head subunit gpT-like protein